MPVYSISLGQLSDKEIIDGLEAATIAAKKKLTEHFGVRFTVEAYNVATQHQVSGDNKSVRLKFARRDIQLRYFLFEGAYVRFVWTDRRKDEVQVIVGCGVKFQDIMLYVCVALALLMSGLTVMTGWQYLQFGRQAAAVSWFFLFIVNFIPMLIPYVLFRIFSRFRNRVLVGDVFRVVSTH